MTILRHSTPQITEYLKYCLPEFIHVNHYWDKQREMIVAKILPGEFYMSTENIAIATTLGSCISACIWDSKAGIGGMNHFMLPLTEKEAHEVDWGQRGKSTDATRFGNYAMEHLINMILKHGGKRGNLRAKIFGGGKVLKQMSDVGERNIGFVLNYLKTENIPIEGSDIGLVYPRKVLFEPKTGRAFVKKLECLHNDTIARREINYRSQINKSSLDGDVEFF